MSRILVVEKTPNVQALLGKRFPTDDVFVDAMPLPGQALQKVKTRGYDILIWDAVAAGA